MLLTQFYHQISFGASMCSSTINELAVCDQIFNKHGEDKNGSTPVVTRPSCYFDFKKMFTFFQVSGCMTLRVEK